MSQTGRQEGGRPVSDARGRRAEEGYGWKAGRENLRSPAQCSVKPRNPKTRSSVSLLGVEKQKERDR